MTDCRMLAPTGLGAVGAVVLGLSGSGGCAAEHEAGAEHEVAVQTQALRFADNCVGVLLPGDAEAIEQAQERAYRAIRFADSMYNSVPWSAEGDWAFGRGHDRDVVVNAFGAVVHWLDIEDHRGEQQLLYDCGPCSDPTFVAETTFLSPLAVRLCEPFWQVPVSDWSYVFQHEYFHWALIYDDVAYGDAAIELARTNPAQAVLNADNYALFVEQWKNP